MHKALPFDSLFNDPSSLTLTRETAENIAAPFFGASLFPYLAFLYFLNVEENETPKGVTVGFATCLLFVFLTIPAAVVAQQQFGVSLADCDWLHGSAESLLTVTNLVTVIAFRQALNAKSRGAGIRGTDDVAEMPKSAESYAPMTWLVIILTIVASITAIWPALYGAQVHTPYLAGALDLPRDMVTWGQEPTNSLSVTCWIIHISSLVEFLVAMGFAWRWGDVCGNQKWKGITWGLLPLHTSGITACTYHLFYNRIPVLVPIQAILTCLGNTTSGYAAYRLAISNGWKLSSLIKFTKQQEPNQEEIETILKSGSELVQKSRDKEESPSLIGFEDLGDALANDNDYTFIIKLFLGCAVASYIVKYGEILFDFPFESNIVLSLLVILVPTILNAFKWYKRSQDPTFEGWF